MKQFTLKFSLALIFLSLLAIENKAQITGTNSVLNISANTPTVVDANLTITQSEDIDIVSVVVTGGYVPGANGDKLSYTGTLPSGVTPWFDDPYGIMRFYGRASAATWQTFLRTVTIQTTNSSCYSPKRSVTFILGAPLYNIANGHFYDFRIDWDTWEGSKEYAESTSFYGRKGYLATITDKDENNIVATIREYNSMYSPWIGGSDNFEQINAAKGFSAYANQAASDGSFYWVTGPESGTQFSAQNSWESGGTSAVSSRYMNWYGGEPNDDPDNTTATPGEEDCLQFMDGTLWNDAAAGNYSHSIIEYGDMPYDATTNNNPVLTRNIIISGASSGNVATNNNNLCPGSNSTTLTLSGLTGTVVRWESSDDEVFSNPSTISNTTSSLSITNITQTTYYRAIVNSTSPQTCSNLPTSVTRLIVTASLPGNIIPVSDQICTNGSVELSLSGYQGSIIKWQRSTSSTFASSIIDINTSANVISDALSSAGTYYYRAQVNNNSCGNAFSDILPVTVTSGTPNNGGILNNNINIALCGNSNSGTLTLNGYTGNISKWQTSMDNGIVWSDVSNTSNTYNFAGLTSNTTFRAVVGTNACPVSNSNNINVYLNNNNGTWTGNDNNDWTNSNNWCGSVPSLSTDVIVPAGRLVPNIDNSSSCKNLTFVNGATLTFTSGKKLEIAGAISGNTVIDATNGEIVLKSNIEQTLPASSFYLNKIQDLTIDNTSSGGVTLSGNLTVTGTSKGLTFVNGVINSSSSSVLIIDDKALTTGGGNSTFVNGPLRKIGKDAYVFPIGKDGKYAPCEISGASANNSSFTAEYFNTRYPVLAMDASLLSVSGREYWNISRVNSGPVDVSLYYFDASFSGIVSATTARLRVAHFNSVSNNWEDLAGGALVPSVSGGNKVTLTNLNSFSPFTFGSPTGFNPLPVALIDFVAIADNTTRTVNLTWETASEENNKYFEVLYSTDFTNWTSIGRVNSKGPGHLNNYTFNHQHPGTINHYKLKEVATSGDYVYSDIKLATLNTSAEGTINIYPNPSTGAITIANASEESSFDITDLTGKVIRTGNFSNTIEIKDLPKGVYLMRLLSEGSILNQKIIIQ